MKARRPVAKTSPKTTATKRAKPKAVQPKRKNPARPRRNPVLAVASKLSLAGVAKGLLAWQGTVWYKQELERHSKYEAARAYAKSVGKPLLVVGGPLGGLNRKLTGVQGHGYGDVCIDVDPAACAGAPSDCKVVVGDVRSIPYPDRYFGAAFASHVLEHLSTVAECERALAELRRVADAVFIAGPSKQAITGWVHPEHHLWVQQLPDGSVKIEQR